MSDLRQAAEQALQALEELQYAVVSTAKTDDVSLYYRAIVALSAALAEPTCKQSLQVAEQRLTVAQQSAEQHQDDAAVDRFAAAMKAKLKKKRQEGRAGWQFMASEQLSALLHEHVRKGDPVDVANLAMMLHQNGQVIEPPAAVLWRCTVCGRVGTVGLSACGVQPHTSDGLCHTGDK